MSRRIILTLVTCCAAGAGPLAAQPLAVRETSLGVRPAGAVSWTAEFSHAMRLGYVVETAAGDAVVMDGVRGPLFTDIHTARQIDVSRVPYIGFSPDGKRFTYRATQGERTVVVVDSVAGRFEAVGGVRFSADSRHVVYVARRDGRRVVVRDGVPGRAYDAVHDWRYSTDSEHLVYTARRDGRDYLVVDGREVADAEEIRLVYSDSSDRLVYVVKKKGEGQAVVVDGAEGKTYSHVEGFRFSRDGRRLLYVARDSSGRRRVVVDGIEGRAYEGIVPDSPGFSDDSRHVAFAAVERGQAFWVLDGEEQRRYDRVDVPFYRPSFTPDGRLAYSARRGDAWFAVIGAWEGERFDQLFLGPRYLPNGHVTYIAMRGGQRYVGVDSARLAFDDVAEVPWTRRLVISARRGGQWYVLVDGVASAPYGELVRYIVESRDGRRVAYQAGREGKQFVVVDGVEGRPYDELGRWWMAFSPDGRHVAYTARRGDRWVVVVDGGESPEYDEIIAFGAANRTSSDSFSVLARRGAEDLRVTIPWPRG